MMMCLWQLLASLSITPVCNLSGTFSMTSGKVGALARNQRSNWEF
jgi:hypothetical protein